MVEPNLEPATYAYYEAISRLYISPTLGKKRLDRLQVRDVQTWLNKLPKTCQCCVQRKDATKPEDRRRCCAIGECCQEYPGRRTVQAARNILRTVLNHAKASDELVSRNVAAMAKVPSPPRRRRKGSAWSVEEASRFLASAREDGDTLYAAYVLILVNGLRKGEVLGLVWPSIDEDEAELDISWQLQRIGKQLIHKKRVKTEDSDADDTVPLPDICSAALKLRHDDQEAARTRRVTGGSPATWCSPPSGAPPSSRGTSTAASTPAVPRRASRESGCTTPATPAPRFWPPWTCTRG